VDQSSEAAWSQKRTGDQDGPVDLEDVRRFLREMPIPGDATTTSAIAAHSDYGAVPEANIKSLNIPGQAEEASAEPAKPGRPRKTAEDKAQEPGPIPLTRKEIVRFWEELAAVDVSKPINQFAGAVVRWMAGVRG